MWGGGNSAGQAAMYLSTFAEKVHIMIRRESLVSSMSSYLIDQINKTENIELLPYTEVVEACGDGNLQRLVLQNTQNESTEDVNADGLFIFIGARLIPIGFKIRLSKMRKASLKPEKN